MYKVCEGEGDKGIHGDDPLKQKGSRCFFFHMIHDSGRYCPMTGGDHGTLFVLLMTSAPAHDV